MTLTIHRGINQSDGCITGNGGVKIIIWLIEKVFVSLQRF